MNFVTATTALTTEAIVPTTVNAKAIYVIRYRVTKYFHRHRLLSLKIIERRKTKNYLLSEERSNHFIAMKE